MSIFPPAEVVFMSTKWSGAESIGEGLLSAAAAVAIVVTACDEGDDCEEGSQLKALMF